MTMLVLLVVPDKTSKSIQKSRRVLCTLRIVRLDYKILNVTLATHKDVDRYFIDLLLQNVRDRITLFIK